MFNPYEKVQLGSTGLKMTRLALGTGFLGGMYEAITEERFRSTVDAAYALGLNYFDTSPDYGMGISEQYLGAALQSKPRDTFILSTKVGQLIRTDDTVEPGAVTEHFYDNILMGVPIKKIVIDFSYDAAMRSVEESLARMGMDRVDVVYIHDTFTEQNYRAAMNGAYRALHKLREQNVIRAIGVGVGLTDKLVSFARAGDFNCFLVAGRYTLLDQSALTELLPLCLQKGIAITIGGVFNSGILANPYQAHPRFEYEPAGQEILQKAQRIADICAAHGVPLKAAALQFPLAHPAVLSVVCGATNPAEVSENADLLQVPIPASLWSDLRAAGLLPADVPTP